MATAGRARDHFLMDTQIPIAYLADGALPSLLALSAAAMMVRLGVAKKLLVVRDRPRWSARGRNRSSRRRRRGA
jgi:hypothetical protein